MSEFIFSLLQLQKRGPQTTPTQRRSVHNAFIRLHINFWWESLHMTTHRCYLRRWKEDYMSPSYWYPYEHEVPMSDAAVSPRRRRNLKGETLERHVGLGRD